MLDWDALMPADDAASRTVEAGTGAVVPGKTANVPHAMGRLEASNGKASSDILGAVPNVPSKNVEEGIEAAPAGERGEGKHLRARREDRPIHPHQVSPSAVLLCLAWCNRKRTPDARRWLALARLDRRPPGEQVRVWSRLCRRIGLKPWQVLAQPTAGEGKDCTFCRHFVQVVDRIPGRDRREFHWSCGLGYLILELGRATERILIAPPECESWERFYPGPVR